MGLFDKLLDKGARALGDMVSDKISDVVNGDNEVGETLRSMKSAVSSFTGSNEGDSWEEVGSHRDRQSTGFYGEERSFDEKLRTILQNAGNYELRESISPDELEQEFGREIYERKGYYCQPDNITYGIYKDGRRVLLIRLWQEQRLYRHRANRQIKDFCFTYGIKILDFFDHLPNEEDYMEDRIRQYLI